MIEQLSGLLTGGMDSETKSRLVREVWKREKDGFTAVGNSVALAHAVTDFISEVGIVCIKTDHEIDWALQQHVNKNRLVRLVFLFVIPESMIDDEDREELEVLKQVVLKAGRVEIVERLLQHLPEICIQIFTEKGIYRMRSNWMIQNHGVKEEMGEEIYSAGQAQGDVLKLSFTANHRTTLEKCRNLPIWKGRRYEYSSKH